MLNKIHIIYFQWCPITTIVSPFKGFCNMHAKMHTGLKQHEKE